MTAAARDWQIKKELVKRNTFASERTIASETESTITDGKKTVQRNLESSENVFCKIQSALCTMKRCMCLTFFHIGYGFGYSTRVLVFVGPSKLPYFSTL
ncbi:hypothetical protein NPIL_613861 [Nephila pilipes]|uniref:Uncharacterized protein n=1 Tax=Nephila pilipes TaxID=299642 RepID=A0A8X6Q0W0_NEPPI|nr:hypothetical protein NPIL_613861 [Nephila pilipes]